MTDGAWSALWRRLPGTGFSSGRLGAAGGSWPVLALSSGGGYFFLPGTAGVSWWGRRAILLPSQTSGSYLRLITRSFIGMSALSVILMPSGQTSVQHLVMLQ